MSAPGKVPGGTPFRAAVARTPLAPSTPVVRVIERHYEEPSPVEEVKKRRRPHLDRLDIDDSDGDGEQVKIGVRPNPSPYTCFTAVAGGISTEAPRFTDCFWRCSK